MVMEEAELVRNVVQQLMILCEFLLKSGLIAACPCASLEQNQNLPSASLEQENGITALGENGQGLNLCLQLHPWVLPLGNLQDP